MKIKFVHVHRIDPEIDGLAFSYVYHTEAGEPHFLKVVIDLETEIQCYMNNVDLLEYSERAFIPVIRFLCNYWRLNQKLPNENSIYYEGVDLDKVTEAGINWHNYVLDLSSYY